MKEKEHLKRVWKKINYGENDVIVGAARALPKRGRVNFRRGGSCR